LNRILQIESCLDCKFITGGSYCVKTGTAVDGEIPEDCPLPVAARSVRRKRNVQWVAPGDELLRNRSYYEDMFKLAQRHGYPSVTEAARVLYTRLLSFAKVGGYLGVSGGTVRRIVKDYGWPVAPRGGSVAQRRARV
jgi:hypothetical protein